MITTDPSIVTRIDGRLWVAPGPTSIRQYPRTPYLAVQHGIEFVEGQRGPLHPWTGRGMTAVARCFGLRTAMTGDIPKNIPGPQFSAIRQYRWLRRYHPSLTFPAPHPNSFGTGVPIGAILYWDETGTSEAIGGVGIAIGYQNGVLQQLCATDDAEKSWEIRDVSLFGCAGWTLPVFYAPSSLECWALWDGDGVGDVVVIPGDLAPLDGVDGGSPSSELSEVVDGGTALKTGTQSILDGGGI